MRVPLGHLPARRHPTTLIAVEAAQFAIGSFRVFTQVVRIAAAAPVVAHHKGRIAPAFDEIVAAQEKDPTQRRGCCWHLPHAQGFQTGFPQVELVRRGRLRQLRIAGFGRHVTANGGVNDSVFHVSLSYFRRIIILAPLVIHRNLFKPIVLLNGCFVLGQGHFDAHETGKGALQLKARHGTVIELRGRWDAAHIDGQRQLCRLSELIELFRDGLVVLHVRSPDQHVVFEIDVQVVVKEFVLDDVAVLPCQSARVVAQNLRGSFQFVRRGCGRIPKFQAHVKGQSVQQLLVPLWRDGVVRNQVYVDAVIAGPHGEDGFANDGDNCVGKAVVTFDGGALATVKFSQCGDNVQDAIVIFLAASILLLLLLLLF